MKSGFTLAALAALGIAVPRPAHAAPKPPVAVIDVCRCSGTVFRSPFTTGDIVVDISAPADTLPNPAPADTCPSGSTIQISWHAEGGNVTEWAYRLDEPNFVNVSKKVTSVTYDAKTLTAGSKRFVLRAIGPKATTETTRAFVLGFAPDTWWSGPDPSSPSLSVKPNGERYALLINGQLAAPIAGSLLSPDSTTVLPSFREPRSSFFEIWKDTLFVRQQDDTVHMNSWIVVHNGGFDSDSPYSVAVTDESRLLPGFPGGPVLEPGPPNGAPIGFRSMVNMSLVPANSPSRTAFTPPYPNFDPTSVFFLPRIAGYQPLFLAGRAFVLAQAVDGDQVIDRRVMNGRDLVLKIENGTATPYEQSLRDKVLTFEVDRAPYFITASPIFSPQPNQTFTSTQWNLVLVASDDDPYQLGAPLGGPSQALMLRRKLKVFGKDAQGNDLVYVAPLTYVNQQNITLAVPAALAPGPCVLEVELCDCEVCEDFPGTGRCISRQFPVLYQPTSSTVIAPTPEVAANQATPSTTVLLAPYPNPATRGSTIRFTLAQESVAELDVFDVSGARVRRIVSERLPAGVYSRTWTGENEVGRRAGQGIYFVRFRAAGVTMTRKLFLAP